MQDPRLMGLPRVDERHYYYEALNQDFNLEEVVICKGTELPEVKLYIFTGGLATLLALGKHQCMQ